MMDIVTYENYMKLVSNYVKIERDRGQFLLTINNILQFVYNYNNYKKSRGFVNFDLKIFYFF